MPYLRCLGCGVVSYAPRQDGGAVCPECGLPWPRRADAVVRSADPERRIGEIVRMTRDLLDVDLALLGEIRDGHEHIRVVAGDHSGPDQLEGRSFPLADTFCGLLLQGEITEGVPDARVDPRTASLSAVAEFGMRAYLGVPILLSDAEQYVLCCLSSEARPSLGAREVRLLAGLAESVRAELEAALVLN